MFFVCTMGLPEATTCGLIVGLSPVTWFRRRYSPGERIASCWTHSLALSRVAADSIQRTPSGSVRKISNGGNGWYFETLMVPPFFCWTERDSKDWRAQLMCIFGQLLNYLFRPFGEDFGEFPWESAA